MKRTHVLSATVIFLVWFACPYLMASQPVPDTDSTWVDSVFKSLTPDQRIAQIFIIRAFSDKDSVYKDSLINLIRKWNPGSLFF